jgi:hypothetical protein
LQYHESSGVFIPQDNASLIGFEDIHDIAFKYPFTVPIVDTGILSHGIGVNGKLVNRIIRIYDGKRTATVVLMEHAAIYPITGQRFP